MKTIPVPEAAEMLRKLIPKHHRSRNWKDKKSKIDMACFDMGLTMESFKLFGSAIWKHFDGFHVADIDCGPVLWMDLKEGRVPISNRRGNKIAILYVPD